MQKGWNFLSLSSPSAYPPKSHLTFLISNSGVVDLVPISNILGFLSLDLANLKPSPFYSDLCPFGSTIIEPKNQLSVEPQN